MASAGLALRTPAASGCGRPFEHGVERHHPLRAVGPVLHSDGSSLDRYQDRSADFDTAASVSASATVTQWP